MKSSVIINVKSPSAGEQYDRAIALKGFSNINLLTCANEAGLFFFLNQLTSNHGIAIESRIKPEERFVFILTAITPPRFTVFDITPPIIRFMASLIAIGAL